MFGEALPHFRLVAMPLVAGHLILAWVGGVVSVGSSDPVVAIRPVDRHAGVPATAHLRRTVAAIAELLDVLARRSTLATGMLALAGESAKSLTSMTTFGARLATMGHNGKRGPLRTGPIRHADHDRRWPSGVSHPSLNAPTVHALATSARHRMSRCEQEIMEFGLFGRKGEPACFRAIGEMV